MYFFPKKYLKNLKKLENFENILEFFFMIHTYCGKRAKLMIHRRSLKLFNTTNELSRSVRTAPHDKYCMTRKTFRCLPEAIWCIYHVTDLK